RRAYHLSLSSFPTRRSSDLDDFRLHSEGGERLLELPALIRLGRLLFAHVFVAGKERGRRQGVRDRRCRLAFDLEFALGFVFGRLDRKSTRLNSSHVKISYAV